MSIHHVDKQQQMAQLLLLQQQWQQRWYPHRHCWKINVTLLTASSIQRILSWCTLRIMKGVLVLKIVSEVVEICLSWADMIAYRWKCVAPAVLGSNESNPASSSGNPEMAAGFTCDILLKKHQSRKGRRLLPWAKKFKKNIGPCSFKNVLSRWERRSVADFFWLNIGTRRFAVTLAKVQDPKNGSRGWFGAPDTVF